MTAQREFLIAAARHNPTLQELARVGRDLGLTLGQVMQGVRSVRKQICAAGYPLAQRSHPPDDVPCHHHPEVP